MNLVPQPRRPACTRAVSAAVTVLAALLLQACASLGTPGNAPAAAAPRDAATALPAPAAAAPPAPPPAAAAPAAPASAPAATASAAPEAVAAPPQPTPPRSRLDPDQDAARSSLWDRIRAGYAMPDAQGELVAKWERYYASRPDYVQRMVERGSMYLFHIVEEVERRGLPAELALLPFIESAFNPTAMSHARASGMWQFMPATGRDFDLTQNLFRDDRRDVLASTRAALDYLQRLHGLFGDWHLALAAYNWGQGNVLRAVERNRRARMGTDYASLRMPDETRNYVPKLQAVKNIVGDPQRLGLSLPPLENHPYFLSVSIERDIDVAVAARLADLEEEDFRMLNPQHNKPVILAAGTPQVLLPYENANRFVAALAAAGGRLASWTAWVAPRTLKPAEAAQLVGMSEDRLREVNRIPARMLVRQGSTLLVPRSDARPDDVPEVLAESATLSFTPEGRAMRQVRLRASPRGESVAAFARRHGVSAAQLSTWNPVSAQGRLRPGQVVVVMRPVPTARSATAAKRPAARSRAAGPRAQQAAKAPRAKAGAQPQAKPRPRVAQAAPR